MRSSILIFLFLFPSIHLLAQKSGAIVSGKILDENERPLAKVSIVLLGRESGLVSSDSGTFVFMFRQIKPSPWYFSYTGYKSLQQNFILNDQEEERIVIRMERMVSDLGAGDGHR